MFEKIAGTVLGREGPRTVYGAQWKWDSVCGAWGTRGIGRCVGEGGTKNLAGTVWGGRGT
jgi:hypothetical protein